MKRKDILVKSRQSHRDEGMEHAENQGRKIGFITFAILAILSLLFWEIGTLHAVSSLFWTYFCADGYVKLCFTKKETILCNDYLREYRRHTRHHQLHFNNIEMMA